MCNANSDLLNYQQFATIISLTPTYILNRNLASVFIVCHIPITDCAVWPPLCYGHLCWPTFSLYMSGNIQIMSQAKGWGGVEYVLQGTGKVSTNLLVYRMKKRHTDLKSAHILSILMYCGTWLSYAKKEKKKFMFLHCEYTKCLIFLLGEKNYSTGLHSHL